jgi:O-antigen/teichoic acid export membrane protein
MAWTDENGLPVRGFDMISRGLRSLGHRRFRAVGHLLTGTSATVVLSLGTVALAARALGVQQYGVLALILTLGQACERLLSFQSWQPLIRYGATLQDSDGHDDLRSLYKFGLLLDLAGSGGAWAVSSLLLIAGHFLFAIPLSTVGTGLIFMVSLMFNLNGTATAIFRLEDRFRTSARLQILSAVIRLAASVLAFWLGAGLLGFVLVWTITQILQSLLNITVALSLLRQRGVTRIARASLAGISDRFPDLWKFTWGANISLTIWASAQQLDTLLVGWLADPAAAGMFQIAKRVSRVVQQIGSQVEAVVYPDLSRMWAAGNRSSFVRLILQTEFILAAFGGACFVGALLLGRWALVLTAGPRFAGAAPLLSVQILAVALTISGAVSRAALLSMGRQPAVLRTVLAAALTFYCAVVPLIHFMGAMGANMAHVLFGTVWLSGLALSLRSGLRQSPAPEPSASATAALEKVA